MCEPATLALASAGVAATGKIVGGIQSAATARYQARVAERNASLAVEQGRDAQQRGQLEASRAYRRIGQVKGQQIAAMAANGIDLGFGSALQVQQDSAMIGAEDVGQIYKATSGEFRGFDISASNYRAQSQGGRQAARGALVGAVFDAGSTALGGAKQYRQLKTLSG